MDCPYCKSKMEKGTFVVDNASTKFFWLFVVMFAVGLLWVGRTEHFIWFISGSLILTSLAKLRKSIVPVWRCGLWTPREAVEPVSDERLLAVADRTKLRSTYSTFLLFSLGVTQLSGRKSVFIRFVSDAVFLMGLFCIGLGLYGVYQGMRVFRFRRAKGVVTYSRVGKSCNWNGTYEDQTYYPDIHVRYVVDGETYDTGCYEVNRIATSRRTKVTKVLRRYPVGRDVNVWFDPSAPGTAVISRSFRCLPVVIAIGGAAMVAFARHLQHQL